MTKSLTWDLRYSISDECSCVHYYLSGTVYLKIGQVVKSGLYRTSCVNNLRFHGIRSMVQELDLILYYSNQIPEAEEIEVSQ